MAKKKNKGALQTMRFGTPPIVESLVVVKE